MYDKNIEARDITQSAQSEAEVEEQKPVEVPRSGCSAARCVDEGRAETSTIVICSALRKEKLTHPPKQITVILRSTGDKEHDKRRIKTLYGTLISFHDKTASRSMCSRKARDI